jgi:hypothetical protein
LTEISRTTRKTRSWHAWSSTIGDIERLSTKFEEIVLERAKEIEGPQPFIAQMTLDQDGDEVVGPLENVQAEIDRRTFDSIRWSAGDTTRPDNIFIFIYRRRQPQYRSGVHFGVSSEDRSWASSAFTQLSRQLELSVPSWSWIRRQSVRMVLTLLPVCGSIAYLGVIATSKLQYPVLQVLFTLSIAAALVVIVVSDQIFNWFFPIAEITLDGNPSSWRRIGGLVIYLAGLPLGILVNWIS